MPPSRRVCLWDDAHACTLGSRALPVLGACSAVSGGAAVPHRVTWAESQRRTAPLHRASSPPPTAPLSSSDGLSVSPWPLRCRCITSEALELCNLKPKPYAAQWADSPASKV